jgi:hypothetical protein
MTTRFKMPQKVEIIVDGFTNQELATQLRERIPATDFTGKPQETSRGVWSDPAVVSAIVTGGATVLAAVIGALVLLKVERDKRQHENQKKPSSTVIVITTGDKKEQRFTLKELADKSSSEIAAAIELAPESVTQVLCLDDE